MRQYDINNMAKVLGLVSGYVEKELRENFVEDEIPEFQVFIVFYTYILGGYKATVATSMKDDRYYEVTYNSAKLEHYIDVYHKIDNVAVADGPLKAPLN